MSEQSIPKFENLTSSETLILDMIQEFEQNYISHGILEESMQRLEGSYIKTFSNKNQDIFGAVYFKKKMYADTLEDAVPYCVEILLANKCQIIEINHFAILNKTPISNYDKKHHKKFTRESKPSIQQKMNIDCTKAKQRFGFR